MVTSPGNSPGCPQMSPPSREGPRGQGGMGPTADTHPIPQLFRLKSGKKRQKIVMGGAGHDTSGTPPRFAALGGAGKELFGPGEVELGLEKLQSRIHPRVGSICWVFFFFWFLRGDFGFFWGGFFGGGKGAKDSPNSRACVTAKQRERKRRVRRTWFSWTFATSSPSPPWPDELLESKTHFFFFFSSPPPRQKTHVSSCRDKR